MRLTTCLAAMMLLISPAVAAPELLLRMNENGVASAGGPGLVTDAIRAGRDIKVVYANSVKTFSRPCSSVGIFNDTAVAYCFVRGAFDTESPMVFADPVAFEDVIFGSDGSRSSVKFDSAGNQLTFKGGDCDQMQVCNDTIALSWFATN